MRLSARRRRDSDRGNQTIAVPVERKRMLARTGRVIARSSTSRRRAQRADSPRLARDATANRPADLAEVGATLIWHTREITRAAGREAHGAAAEWAFAAVRVAVAGHAGSSRSASGRGRAGRSPNCLHREDRWCWASESPPRATSYVRPHGRADASGTRSSGRVVRSHDRPRDSRRAFHPTSLIWLQQDTQNRIVWDGAFPGRGAPDATTCLRTAGGAKAL